MRGPASEPAGPRGGTRALPGPPNVRRGAGTLPAVRRTPPTGAGAAAWGAEEEEAAAGWEGEKEGEIDYVFKVVLIGDSAVGKSSLLVSFVSAAPTNDDLSPTIGIITSPPSLPGYRSLAARSPLAPTWRQQ